MLSTVTAAPCLRDGQGESALKTRVRQRLREIQVCPTAALPALDPGPWPQPPVCPQTSLLKSWRELNSDRTSHPHCPLCLVAGRGAHWLTQASACTRRRNQPPPPSSPFQRCQPSQVVMLPLWRAERSTEAPGRVEPSPVLAGMANEPEAPNHLHPHTGTPAGLQSRGLPEPGLPLLPGSNR